MVNLSQQNKSWKLENFYPFISPLFFWVAIFFLIKKKNHGLLFTRVYENCDDFFFFWVWLYLLKQ